MELVNELLERYGDAAIFLVPALAFAEACIGIGIFVSGAFLLLLSSVLYSNGLAGADTIMLLACLGAVAGDHIGFYCGVLMGPGFHHSKWAKEHKGKLDKAEALVRRYGAFAIFIGRFVPAVRSIIPALIGISGFDRRRYSLLDIAACLLWSAALSLIVMGIDVAV